MAAARPTATVRATSHALSSSSGRSGLVAARRPAPASTAVVARAGKKDADAPPRTLADNLSFEDGIFAPAVRITIAFIGLKDLNKIRGKAIALHSQVITSFCKQVGAPPKTKQGLIRLAKKNGHKLGFLVTEPAW